MKNVTKVIILLVIAFFVGGCTNLDDIRKQLDDHETRLSALENLVKSANSSIANLQQLLDAQAKKITVNSVEPTADGYVLNMSDGSKINISNGKDGLSPAIGVKEEGGVLYWTLDGEFMLDAYGNKIKAEGQDGASGMTPQIRVDAEGYWEVSTDGGKTWQAVTDVNGKKVKAKGSDATVDLQITEDENAITIIYNGQKFVIPKTGSTPNPSRPLMAIEYFAEYNIASDGVSFATTHANDVCGRYNFDDAVAKFGVDAAFKVNGEGYHLPTLEELQGILPGIGSDFWPLVRFDKDLLTENVTESITINGVNASYTADYQGTVNNVGYGLRFKGGDNSQLSAWRYERKDNPLGGKMTIITARYLGPDKAATKLADITNEDFWATPGDDITLTFPSTGINGGQGVNDYTMLWTSDRVSDNTAKSAYIFSGGAYAAYAYSGKATRMAIRLVKDVK